VKETHPEWYYSARNAILSMKPDALQKEMTLRNIERARLAEFVDEGWADSPEPSA
jgi:hypothetical protein